MGKVDTSFVGNRYNLTRIHDSSGVMDKSKIEIQGEAINENVMENFGDFRGWSVGCVVCLFGPAGEFR
jgi:hypothetical protein